MTYSTPEESCPFFGIQMGANVMECWTNDLSKRAMTFTISNKVPGLLPFG
jgi:hypothetical protein